MAAKSVKKWCINALSASFKAKFRTFYLFMHIISSIEQNVKL